MNSNDEYVERCCKALEKLLKTTPVDVVLGQVNDAALEKFLYSIKLYKTLFGHDFCLFLIDINQVLFTIQYKRFAT